MNIQYKLFAALLLTCALLIVSLFVLMRWSIDQGMVDYVNTRKVDRLERVSEQIASRYEENNDWHFLDHRNRDLREILRQSEDQPRPYREHHDDYRDGHREHSDEHRPYKEKRRPPKMKLAILDADKNNLYGRFNPNKPHHLVPIKSQQQLIGWIAYPKRKDVLEGFELHFIEKQRSAFAMISSLVLLLAAMVAFLLSRHLVRPIKAIAHGAHQLTQGNYKVNIDATRRDELGELARDFNQLANTIANNDQARKRWLADTSHELRTPIAILKGELEAMLDGVRPIDEKNIRSAHEEIEQLRLLVDDLYELSNADIGALRYRKECVDLNELLESHQEALQSQAQQANLKAQLNIPPQAIEVWADYGRIKQLISNVINNACKYTDAGGQVTLQLTSQEEYAELLIEDSAPGVPEDSYDKLFDHLYRVETSRNRATGGSGLGLAICERIVHAHQGTIQATPSPLGGLAIRIRLPLMETQA